MNLYLRLLWVLLRLPFSRRIGVDQALREPCRFPTIVLPNDLDLNLHVNNGRVLTIMDLGMLYLMGRGGLFRLMADHGMKPVVGGALLKYRRSLHLFDIIAIETRLLSWDAKWFYFEHRLAKSDGQEAAMAIMRTCLVKRGDVVAPAEVMGLLGFYDPPPHRGPLDRHFDEPFLLTM